MISLLPCGWLTYGDAEQVLRLEQEECAMNRAMREEQDSAYERALAADEASG
jgi:hypothetical protein